MQIKGDLEIDGVFSLGQLTQAERDSLTAPSSGAKVFNLTSQKVETYINGAWIEDGASSSGAEIQSFTLNIEPGLATQNKISGRTLDSISSGAIKAIYNNGRLDMSGFSPDGTVRCAVSPQTLNGRAVAAIDGSTRYQTSPDTFANEGELSRPIGGASPFSMGFSFVVNVGSTGLSQTLFSMAGTEFLLDWSDGNCYFDFGSTARRIVVTRGEMGIINRWVLISGFYVVGADGDTASKIAGIRVNGVTKTPVSVAHSISADPDVAFANAYLFGVFPGGNSFRGKVAQITFITPEPDGGQAIPEDLLKLEGYHAHKWGLEGDLDTAHPYKSAPPASYPVSSEFNFPAPAPALAYTGILDTLGKADEAIVACSNRILSNSYGGLGVISPWVRIRKGTIEADVRFDELTGDPDLNETYYPGTTIARGETVDEFALGGTIDVSVMRWFNQANHNKDFIAFNILSAPKLYRAVAAGGFSAGLQTMNGRACFSLTTTEQMRLSTLYQGLVDTNGFSILNIQQLGSAKGRTIDATTGDKMLFTIASKMATAGAAAGKQCINVEANPSSESLAEPATTDIQSYGVSYNTDTSQMYVNGAVSGDQDLLNNGSDWGGFGLNGATVGQYSDVSHQEFIMLPRALTAQQHLDWFVDAQTKGMVP